MVTDPAVGGFGSYSYFCNQVTCTLPGPDPDRPVDNILVMETVRVGNRYKVLDHLWLGVDCWSLLDQ